MKYDDVVVDDSDDSDDDDDDDGRIEIVRWNFISFLFCFFLSTRFLFLPTHTE